MKALCLVAMTAFAVAAPCLPPRWQIAFFCAACVYFAASALDCALPARLRETRACR